MVRRLASLLVLSSLVLVAPSVRAQGVDPGRDPSGTGEDALLALAGPRARVRRDEEGRVRLLFGARMRPWSGDPARDALALTQRFGDAFGIPQGAELRVERAQTHHGFTIVRLRRYADGRPVLGATVVVRSLADGAIDMVLADAGPARVEGGVSIDATHAAEIARGLEVGWRIAGTTSPAAIAIDLVDTIVPVWAIDLHGAALSQRMRALLDARDGAVLGIVPLLTHAMARVYETNPTTTEGVTSDVELTDLASGAQNLTSQYFHVSQCDVQSGGGCAGTQRALADAEGNFLYDAVPGSHDDEFAEVNAFHHLSRAAAWHRERHGFTWTCSGTSAMRVFVNYGEVPDIDYDNAAFSPASGGQCGFLLFGQGRSGDYAYDADVVYHEFGHAVTDQVATMTGFAVDPLGVSYEPLAVNEGTSDYYAGTLQGNAEIAESFAGAAGDLGAHGSLRVIDNDLTCPSGLFGEGHFDGTIWAATAWDLRERIGVEAADALVFTTVASIAEDPSLAEAGDLMIATAEGMVATGALSAEQASAVEEIVGARGLPGCQRIVALDDGTERRGWSGNEFLTAGVGRSIAPVHYRIDVPVDATSLRIAMTSLTRNGQYRLHLLEDQPVRVNAARVTAQAAVPVEGGAVVLDESTTYRLPRCKTLYFAIESVDLRRRGQNLYTVQATLERSGDPSAECPVVELPDASIVAADAGADASTTAPSSGGGCGCRVGTGTSEPSAIIAMIALGIMIASRRRRV
ncbi:MYXO-CTERM sorting domain-containing protein [Sandaracinus amylolyticus]|uniref:MYXO-CTERM sorting domain-containing protein n=1 Tax=Sandaracinus amylolyticus TaxID=927083 RepID=UPI001F3D024B|nr:MYXO-CTERM sorting domain-containing protein [Sandaracinus amylolyticus]UJR79624.1 Bacillolysin [Sandaracinus amylolyticus]